MTQILSELDRSLLLSQLESDSISKPSRLANAAAHIQDLQVLDCSPLAWPCLLCDAEIGDACNIGSLFHYSRGFHINSQHPGGRHDRSSQQAKECRASLEDGPYDTARGMCLGCDWVGPLSTDDNTAVEDAHDHAFAQWRSIPLVPAEPSRGTSAAERKLHTRWLEAVLPFLPAGWTESFGPIRTQRHRYGTRHVPMRTSWGGYDICGAVIPDATAPMSINDFTQRAKGPLAMF